MVLRWPHFFLAWAHKSRHVPINQSFFVYIFTFNGSKAVFKLKFKIFLSKILPPGNDTRKFINFWVLLPGSWKTIPINFQLPGIITQKLRNFRVSIPRNTFEFGCDFIELFTKVGAPVFFEAIPGYHYPEIEKLGNDTWRFLNCQVLLPGYWFEKTLFPQISPWKRKYFCKIF